jgi:crossover junction endodeoxyribonuclease RuvC
LRVLGIDPGLRLTGYALVDASRDRLSLVEAGVFRVTKGAGNTALSVSARLEELDSDFRAALKRLQPDKIAIESIFAHHKHPATAIVMGHARGVLLLAVQQAGNGHADKSQMQRAVQAYFGLAEPPEPPDVADAIAIAMCASQRHGAVV